MATLTEPIASSNPRCESQALRVALLTGGVDRPYAYGLTMALAALNVQVDVIGSDIVDSPEMHTTLNVTFFNLWPARSAKPMPFTGLVRLLGHYALMIRYAAVAEPRVFHILWNSKIQLFDRTLMMLYYRALGKKIAFTAHNVNQARRDRRDNWLNRLTLRIQYHLTNHIFVHTQKMKDELVHDFSVEASSVTVIPYPLDNAFPNTDLTPSEARAKLGVHDEEKAILCLGKIKPYKGIEYLLSAFHNLAAKDARYRLIIAGQVQKGSEQYLEALLRAMPEEMEKGRVILRAQFIRDEEIEFYLKAADVLVLPYKEIFQSGMLFLGYSFGLPVIATDVGSFREEIVEGRTGYLCRPGDPEDLARAIETYFASDLYRNLDTQRLAIRNHADRHHSAGAVAVLTRTSYEGILRNV